MFFYDASMYLSHLIDGRSTLVGVTMVSKAGRGAELEAGTDCITRANICARTWLQIS